MLLKKAGVLNFLKVLSYALSARFFTDFGGFEAVWRFTASVLPGDH